MADAPTAAPSDWLRRFAHLLPSGARVLDVACGAGRHLRWLAGRPALNPHLIGVDRDAQATAGLQAIAEIVTADLEADPWPLPGRRFDLVLVTHYLWRPLLPLLVDSVAEDGLLIYETFADGQQYIGRPSRPDFLLQAGELLNACTDLQVLAYEHGRLSAPERCIQRVVARRGASAALPLEPEEGPRPDR